MTDYAEGRRTARWALYVAIVLSVVPAVILAALWLRLPGPGLGAVFAAAMPFAACLLPLFARTREHIVLFRGLATALLMASALATIDLWFLFLPGILAMGTATVLAALNQE